MVFVKAQVGPPNIGDSSTLFTVQYFDENGNMTIRSGGTRAWRCNNPGNLIASPYSTSTKRRSIGKAGDGKNVYAVYPDYQTGHEALVVMLKGSIYSILTLRAAIKRYDPTNPNYINIILSKTGFDSERKIKSLNAKEFEQFWKAIEETENWKAGREDFILRWHITGIHMKRGTIQEYRIRQNEKDIWLSKQDAIALAQEKKFMLSLSTVRMGSSIYALNTMENVFARCFVNFLLLFLCHGFLLFSSEDHSLSLPEDEPEHLVSITGKLQLRTTTRDPEYNDKEPVCYWALKVDSDSYEIICKTPVRASFQTPNAIRASQNSDEVALTGEYNEDWLNAHLNQNVTIKGYLWHAHTGHHPTTVMMGREPWIN